MLSLNSYKVSIANFAKTSTTTYIWIANHPPCYQKLLSRYLYKFIIEVNKNVFIFFKKVFKRYVHFRKRRFRTNAFIYKFPLSKLTMFENKNIAFIKHESNNIFSYSNYIRLFLNKKQNIWNKYIFCKDIFYLNEKKKERKEFWAQSEKINAK